MSRNLYYLWIQRKRYQDATVLIKNGVCFHEGADNYPNEYNRFYSLLRRPKRVYDKDGITIGLSFTGTSISSTYSELDEAGRRLPYSFFSKNTQQCVVDELITVSNEQGYFIPDEELTIMKLVISQQEQKRRVLIISAAIVFCIVLLFVLLFNRGR